MILTSVHTSEALLDGFDLYRNPEFPCEDLGPMYDENEPDQGGSVKAARVNRT